MTRPVVLSESMVLGALADPKFISQAPEFSGFQGRAKSLPPKPSGCRHCYQIRAVTSLLRDFIYAVMALGSEPRARMKKYFGVESLMLNTHNPKTNQVEVKII